MSADERAWLTDQPIDVGRLIASARHSDAGGLALFIGTTRAERRPVDPSEGPADLVALEYESYQEMALELLRGLRERAIVRFGLIDAWLVHRLGRVPLAEPSVVVIALSAHRREALEACRWMIDALKSDAPIWKKDIWSDGRAAWSRPNVTSP